MQSPVVDFLRSIHEELGSLDEGEVATYIPELAKAAPESFAISFATIDGEVYSVGDSDRSFSIQSVSKPFAYGAALGRLGQQAILRRVGVEPTGEAFNSILLDDRNIRPGVMFNDMELIGIPHRVVIGERGLDEGVLEYRRRTADENESLPLDGAVEALLEKLAG